MPKNIREIMPYFADALFDVSGFLKAISYTSYMVQSGLEMRIVSIASLDAS